MVSINLPKVAVAARELRSNHLIRAGDVSFIEITAPSPPDAVSSADALVGKYLRLNKSSGERFSESDVASQPVTTQGSSLISVGLALHRALGGLLDPDYRIDIYGVPKVHSGEVSEPTRLASNLRLITTIKGGSDQEPTITLILELPVDSDNAAECDSICRKLAGASDLFIVVNVK